MVSEKIVIKAPPEVVFEAIRKQRTGADKNRTLQSFDGKTAVVKEELDGVPVFGKVECVWEEVEEPFTRVNFKMLSSSKFKESHGAYILVASNDGKSTTLELQAHMDAGLNIPFAAELTKQSTSKDSKLRLERIKKLAEDDFKAST
ncbi:MAG: SRPBCC family protein [Candidatus Obscuribacterales bacterium]|nr:SRPBCC family protein [Candidatus Obscuribacterales bacterium]